ncbi:MAG: NAD(P)H-dependent oxidoreductase [Asticcacaulis sp.]
MSLSVAVIVGSLRKDSINRKLAQGVMKLNAPDLGFKPVEIGDLPLYNQDSEDSPSPATKKFRAEIETAQALLFISPEYNRSIPGLLKNAIDTGSRPMGHNRWSGKPAGVFGISPGAIGTAAMQQHMRPVLAAVGVHVYAGQEIYLTAKDDFFDAAGDINPRTQAFLQGWMDGFADYVKKLTN